MSIRILTAYHFEPKDVETVDNGVYTPFRLDWLTLNPRVAPTDKLLYAADTYAEMRMHWWALKNWSSGITHYGFQHYRRWFLLEPYGLSTTNLVNMGYEEIKSMFADLHSMDETQQWMLTEWVKQFHIVTVKPHATNLSGQFMSCHGVAGWRAMIAALDHMEWRGPRDAKVFYHGNMFIIRPDYFKRYMTFWREVMRRISYTLPIPDNKYQRRLYAFLSERLWTLWLLQERLTHEFPFAEVPVVTCDGWKVL